jgi:uncharacterized protein YndB with AHSA1/START domain
MLRTLVVMTLWAAPLLAAETLPNGIRLPERWPPKRTELSREPLPTPPYLVSPPAVIPIDVGRQLLVDDFLIQSTTLRRTHHRPQYHPANPLLVPDKPWEGTGGRARAAMFSDGVWYDPADRQFKLWYWAASRPGEKWRTCTCYATSQDGIHWEKPVLDVVPGTNIVLEDEPHWRRNSSTLWLDLDDKDPARRFKMFRSMKEEPVEGKKGGSHHLRLSFSADGIHWRTAGDSDSCGDRTTVFYNGIRKRWVFGLRDGDKAVSRCRTYYENADPVAGLRWDAHRDQKTLWIGADRLDADRSDLDLRRVPDRPWDLVPSQLYNLDCVAYENLLLGLFSIWRGQPLTRPKINETCVGYSRDGFHWSRPDRQAFCPVSENREAWNWGNLQTAGGCCLVVGDKLHFYVGAVSGRRGAYHPDPTNVGLAVLRRDGFTSMDAAASEGQLTTRPVKFSGRYLFVNVDAPHGRLTAEVLDAAGQRIEPFTRARCVPVTADSTLQQMSWKGADDLSSLAGKTVRLRFWLSDGRLYAFWVSTQRSGASHGFVAAGGPGFTGPTDTIGKPR